MAKGSKMEQFHGKNNPKVMIQEKIVDQLCFESPTSELDHWIQHIKTDSRGSNRTPGFWATEQVAFFEESGERTRELV